MKSIFNPQHFSFDWERCFGIQGQCLTSNQSGFPWQCLSLKSIRAQHVENIFRLHKGTQPRWLWSSLCHNTDDWVANNGTHIALWGGHSGELGLRSHGSLLVKSQYFMIFLKPTSHNDWGHTNKIPIGYDWAPCGHESRCGLSWNTLCSSYIWWKNRCHEKQ